MSTTRKDKRESTDEPHRSETTQVVLRRVPESRVFTFRGDCTVKQLKLCLSEQLRVPAEQLVLTHSGWVLRESELMSHLKGQRGSVSLCTIRRPESSPPQTGDPPSESVQSEVTAVPDPDPIQTPTPCALGFLEGLGSAGLENSRSSFCTASQSQMEEQSLSEPEMVQNPHCSSSPELTNEVNLCNPQFQQVLKTHPEVEDMLNNTGVIMQCPGEDVVETAGRALENVVQGNDENTADPDVLQTVDANWQISQKATFPLVITSFGSPQGPEGNTSSASPLSSDSRDPLKEMTDTPSSNIQGTFTAGIQSLLKEITSSPGLMETLLSGPYISSLLDCLSQNPDVTAQMLLSHPLFSGNVQLQEQIRQQIPLFLQQMQRSELLSMVLNPRAMEALLQIQHGLQTLAVEAPFLVPVAGLGTSGGSDPDPNSQSGCSPQEALLTKQQQQQQFVDQMLKALANANNGVHHEEDFQEELQQLSLMGFRDRQANLQALISTGGDLPSALHLLSLSTATHT
ncbi:PREDICTED: ubiquilin-1 [Cyprinodon variegatus]|uniref:ubiquilin-1 n=1 Tax=Cyprinodon variegatus TaxID=28743 RepID=UPI00074279D5|nr:PREDICTED: ubiquilin-1 [Cyprinodon variegatus]